ncbi:type VI secretion system-associated protein TagF [Serratia sp. DD3]|uniref:type VI secretion system-associated protein TagF n=1 Tax=Serratia sp. DD3 TaxID=1410619 RepID=UPI0003C50515|nr:type VI secretion system-associated protein TagF [Serratia sp. DD3]KEY58752.1 type VI secretion-associated protein, family [Serratia sp. DD3]
MSQNNTHLPEQPANGIGWYGKIPGNGDFVQRRLPKTLVNRWAHWFQSGLVALQLSTPHNSRYSLHGAPLWYFILPTTLGTPFVQLGCLLPSQDRVGRHYPLFAMWLEPPEHWHNQRLLLAVERYYQIGKILQAGIHQRHCAERIDQALQMSPPLSSATIGDCNVTAGETVPVIDFDPYRYGSFWWSNSANSKPFDTYVHSGHLTVQLFHHLFAPIGDARQVHQGPYGQMFDREQQI